MDTPLSPVDILLLVAVAAVIALAIWHMHRKKGTCGCCSKDCPMKKAGKKQRKRES